MIVREEIKTIPNPDAVPTPVEGKYRLVIELDGADFQKGFPCDNTDDLLFEDFWHGCITKKSVLVRNVARLLELIEGFQVAATLDGAVQLIARPQLADE